MGRGQRERLLYIVRVARFNGRAARRAGDNNCPYSDLTTLAHFAWREGFTDSKRSEDEIIEAYQQSKRAKEQGVDSEMSRP
jgi:hypothetical protein